MTSENDPDLVEFDESEILTRAQSTSSSTERELLEEMVVREYLPLADALASRYTSRGVENDDLVAVARMALVGAMRRFDAAVGPFGPFAKATVRGELRKHFRDRAWAIRPPRRVSEARAEVTRCRDERASAGLTFSDPEVAEELGMDVALVTEARRAGDLFSPQSLNARPTSGARDLAETIPDPANDFIRVDDADELASYSTALDDDERELLRLRFADCKTQQEIGDLTGSSQMQISRRLGSIMDKLKKAARRRPSAA